MAPIQNTFSIIPNAISANPADSRPTKRPMTTKQAKKAYREANKGPKLSKAERRRQELFEQDRIRKEFEKERNQARARAARDKKKEKEEQERAERKKKGLPLVEVRASQDTIARFIRTTAKTTTETKADEQHVPKPPTLAAEQDDDDSDTCSSATAEEQPEPPAKRQKTENPKQDEEARKSSSPPSSLPPPSINAIKQAYKDGQKEYLPAVKGIAKLIAEKAEKENISHPYEEQRAMDKPGKIEKPKASSYVEAKKKASAEAQPPTVKKNKTRSTPTPTTTPQPLRDISTEAINARSVEKPGEPAAAEIPQKPQTSAPTSQVFRHPKTSMLPPPLPPKFKSPKPTPSGGSRAPRFLKPTPKPHTTAESSLSRQDSLPPSSTQLFMFNHLDDFFPSPSQEVRELFDEPKISPAKPQNQSDIFDIPFFSTQDFCLSSQDVKDIEDEPSLSLPKDKVTRSTPNLPGNVFDSSNTELHTPTASKAPRKPTPRLIKYSDPIDDDFSNLKLQPKPKQNPDKLAPTRPSMRHIQPPHSSGTRRPILHSPQTRRGQDHNLATSSKSNLTNSVTKPSSTPKQQGNILPNTGAASHQTSTPSSGKVRQPSSNENSSAAPRPSPKPFLVAYNPEMRYKYAMERRKTSAWEDAKARRRAQEELDQLQALEDARLLELLADTGEDNNEQAKEESVQQADERVTDPVSSAPPLGQSQEQQQQLQPPTAKADPQPPKQQQGIITTNSNTTTRNDNRKNDKVRTQKQSSYEQMLELLKKAQSPKHGQNQEERQGQRDASPETDYDDAWDDDDLCDIL